MDLFPAPGLAEEIVRELRHGALKTALLWNRIQRRRKERTVTIQGLYKALRQLRQQEIVFLQQGEAMLNLRWLHKLESFASLTEHAYHDRSGNSGHFLQMQEGDRIAYTFKNPIQVDAFWNHVLYSLFEALPEVDRWFAYASHCWFLLGRRKEELALKQFMRKKEICYLFTAGSSLPLDRAIKYDFDGTWSQYAMLDTPLFQQRSNHRGIVLNVFGPYVIEAQYDKRMVDQIEKFYRTTTTFTKEKSQELELLVAMPAQIKFTISYNANKAALFTKQLEKKFYLKKS